jgi:hypothetical protein
MQCPDREELAAFVTAALPHAQLDSIAEHVKDCAVCATIVEAARAVSSAPQPPDASTGDPFADEPQCKWLEARAMSIQPPDDPPAG